MNDISKLISVTARRNVIFYTEQLKPFGLTSAQFMFIVRICEEEGQTQDELSQYLLIDKSTVAKTLSHLEESGFITKEVNADDKRAFNVYSTAKAKTVYPKIIRIVNEWHEKLTEDLSDLEKEVFEKLMDKVMQNAIAYCK